jgi:hypothetical protein
MPPDIVTRLLTPRCQQGACMLTSLATTPSKDPHAQANRLAKRTHRPLRGYLHGGRPRYAAVIAREPMDMGMTPSLARARRNWIAVACR